jgi:uncharacterized protein YdbL (DUF1318 family)
MLRKLLYASLLASAIALSAITLVQAQAKYSIKTMTPEVESALDGRRGRFDQLNELKNKGSIGENNHGYVEVLGGDSSAESIANAENADRKVIYTTIADQNGLTGAIETIEKVFAQVQRDKAESGQKIQTEDGNWTTK